MLSIVFLLAGLGLFVLLAASRLWWLAPYRAGWVLYLANVFWELVEKRSGLARLWVETVAALLSLALVWAGTGFFAVAAALALALLSLEVWNRGEERRMLTSLNATLARRGLRAEGGEARFPAPSTHPELILTVVAPLVERSPAYRLGLLARGVAFDLELVVGNHTPVPTQHPLEVTLVAPAGWVREGADAVTLPHLPAEAVERLRWTLDPTAVGPGALELRVRWDGGSRVLTIGHDGCREVRADEIREATVTRYPGARRAAFAWRGDMDLYDQSSFQSLRGLLPALELGRRYGIAQTMYVSTRLTLDEASTREWAAHYGVDRGAAEIPRFVTWLRENVAFRHSSPYPVQAELPYVMELGNHGHLHYDTDAAGAPGNSWKAGARPGEGRYPWSGEDTSSFGDQRDNILEAARWCERVLGFVPRSWAKPGRGNDAFTPAAVEAAGCEVATGSDIRARDNVLRQPPPHHPAGTRIVELTARYPSDPQHIQHVAMLLFWMHRAHRLGIPMVMLVHQHMRQFDGIACARFTEYLLRYALERFNGDLYIDTVYGIGAWWRDVLNEETRRVHVTLEDGRVHVTNATDRELTDVPVDLRLAGGERMTLLVSVPAGGEAVVALADPGEERG